MIIKRLSKTQWLIAIVIVIVIIAISIGICYSATYQNSGKGHTGRYFFKSQANRVGAIVYQYKKGIEDKKQTKQLVFSDLNYDGYYYYEFPSQSIKYDKHDLQPAIVEAINIHVERIGEAVELTNRYLKFIDSGIEFKINKYKYSNHIGNFTLDMGKYDYEMIATGGVTVSNKKPNPNNEMYLEIDVICILDEELEGFNYQINLYFDMWNYDDLK